MTALLETQRISAAPAWKIDVLAPAEVRATARWRRTFSDKHKDSRYYELIEDTLHQGFDYRYFAIEDRSGAVRAIQPFFLLDQSVLAGLPALDRAAGSIRKLWPRFLRMKTLMVGCGAGEGHLDLSELGFDGAEILTHEITALGRRLGAHVIVLKEFPAAYRPRLQVFERAWFKRIPSMPMTRLDLNFKNFDDYLANKLSKRTRQDIRRKLRCAEGAAPIEMTVERDITPLIDQIFPLYLQVLERSKMKFEVLTPEFFRRLGQTMPDKARFFLWRRNGKIIAFALCLVQGDKIFAEYLGMDYPLALELHLYHFITRDVINWAISNGYRQFLSTALNYDPKFHMRHVLEPLDLYLRHVNPVLNQALRLAAPFVTPARYDPILSKFPNYGDLWQDRLAYLEMASRARIERSPKWQSAFKEERKDHRYYEVVEDTIHQGFAYSYLTLKDKAGIVKAIQPCFMAEQDLLDGASPRIKKMAGWIRRYWPRFMRMRTLMIGCAAGEAHLDAEDEQSRAFVARALAEGIEDEARRLKTKLIVFKEFTKADRAALACLKDRGFAHVPSMPMTRLRLDCSSFNDYLCKTLSRNTRSQLRRKFKASEQRAQLRLSVVSDVTPHIDEIYPLYLAVYERSKLRLEKLTPEFFRKIGKSMPDKVRFFLWRNGDKIVAFNLCLTSADAVCSEYIGLDYAVAFDLHLYYVVLRDVIQWGFENGYKWYCSTALNYEPKYRFRQELEPLDLYVKHTSPLINFFLKRIVPLIEPTRHDKMLRRFPNYESLRA